MKNLIEFISYRNNNDYEREIFDAFLRKNGFSFNIPTIHIAGTNGKGSTASYLASILNSSGYKVGLFTSPALWEINEMIKIGEKNITDNEIIAILQEENLYKINCDLSSFEIMTYIAFKYFEKNKCDVAIIECGMGGLVDATNVIKPLLSIITTISLEHTGFLGTSLSEIAFHKAGIIKEETPILIGKLPTEAKDVVCNRAKELNSTIYEISDAYNINITDSGYIFDYRELKELFIPTKAAYSIYDASIALESLMVLKDKFGCSEQNIRKGLESIRIPVRQQAFEVNNKTIIVDGAHNPEGMLALKESLLKYNKDFKILFACFRDKNLPGMLMQAGEISNEITLTTFDNPRARIEDEYFLFLGDYKYADNCFEALDEMINAEDNKTIVCTGSLAFGAEIAAYLDNYASKH